jgi:hypothetical protein
MVAPMRARSRSSLVGPAGIMVANANVNLNANSRAGGSSDSTSSFGAARVARRGDGETEESGTSSTGGTPGGGAGALKKKLSSGSLSLSESSYSDSLGGSGTPGSGASGIRRSRGQRATPLGLILCVNHHNTLLKAMQNDVLQSQVEFCLAHVFGYTVHFIALSTLAAQERVKRISRDSLQAVYDAAKRSERVEVRPHADLKQVRVRIKKR